MKDSIAHLPGASPCGNHDHLQVCARNIKSLECSAKDFSITVATRQGVRTDMHASCLLSGS